MIGRRIALNTVALVSGGVLAQICFVSIEVLIARILGQSSYGVFGTVFSLSMSIAVVADMGMTWKLIEDGSRNLRAIPELLGTTLVLKLLFCGVVYVAALLTLPAAGYGLEVTEVFAVFFAYAVIVIIQETLAGVYAAHQRMHVSAFFQGSAPLLILFGVGMVSWLSPTLQAIAWAYVLGSGVVTGLWTYLTFRNENPIVRMRQSLRILSGSYLYGISAILYQIGLGIELILLSLLRDLGEVGLFAAANKFCTLALKAGDVMSRVLSPLLFLQSEHDPEAYRRTCKILLRGVSVFGTFGCLSLALLAEPLLGLIFGEPYRAASSALVLLAISLYARIVAIALQMILSASGEHVRRTGSLGVSLAVAISGGLLLIPSFGIAGAAASHAAADTFYVSAMLRARNLPISRQAAAIWIFGSAIIGTLTFLITWIVKFPLVLEFGLVLAIYALGLFVTRLIAPSEIKELITILRATAGSKDDA